jgi:2Fe-2S ferredoxin
MPFIRFVKPRPPIEVEVGANLMQSLLAAGLPVASSCRGDGVCGKCRLFVDATPGAVLKESDLEISLRERHSIPAGFRVSCQLVILGDITVDATYW